MSLRIATFNVNSVRARLPILDSWLRTVRPDIVCLQETKVENDAFPAEAFRALGYHASFSGQKSYNGVAILTLEAPSAVRSGFEDGGPTDMARLIAVTAHGIEIVNTYVPQGRAVDDPMFPYKIEWFARLRRDLERRHAPTDPILWVGDFNVAPEPMDVHDPKRLADHVCFHSDARRALAEAKAWGFVDVFRHHVPGPGQYTFYDYRTKDAIARKVGWRVDHIWATAPLAERSTAAWIDLEPRTAAVPSDHTPLVAEFDL